MQPFIFSAPSDPREARKQALIAQITGHGAPAPQSTAQGVVQGLGSIVDGFALRNLNRGPFPDAPGGAQPGFFQGLANFFRRDTGGLY